VNDAKVRSRLRNMGWNTGGMIVQPDSTVDAIKLAPAQNCKQDGSLLATFGELTSRVCDACAAKCEHEYTMGMGYYAGNVAYLASCTKCLRVDPDWKPSEDPLEDTLRLVSEGVLDALFLGDTLVTRKE
jgi:hypothetical protein